MKKVFAALVVAATLAERRWQRPVPHWLGTAAAGAVAAGVGERAVSLPAPWLAAPSPVRMATDRVTATRTDTIHPLITAVPACGDAGGMVTPGCAAAFKQ